MYLRFVLHSIDEPTQESLLQCLRDGMDSGDLFAAEFRTCRPKVFSDHYRRYIDRDALVRELGEKYGFRIDYYIKDTGCPSFALKIPILPGLSRPGSYIYSGNDR